MSRRHRAEVRKIIPDAKYKNTTVAKFMNYLMQKGKKTVAEGIVYSSFDILEKELKRSPVEAFVEALENVRPNIEVRSRRVGGATYQVPTDVRPRRAEALALRWIIAAARKRKEKTMRERLAAELLDAINKRGTAIKKREDTHKMAEANKAFAHFRW
jgi:small subunit ribosomal protein S7